MIHIRNATENDIDFIGETCISVAPQYDSIMPGAFAKQAERYRTNGMPTNYTIYIIEEQSVDAGFVGLKQIDKNSSYLVALYLNIDCQQKGGGSRVLELIESKLKKDEIEELVMLVHRNALWAQKFYLKNKYKILGKSKLEIEVYRNGLVKDVYLNNTFLIGKKLSDYT